MGQDQLGIPEPPPGFLLDLPPPPVKLPGASLLRLKDDLGPQPQTPGELIPQIAEGPAPTPQELAQKQVDDMALNAATLGIRMIPALAGGLVGGPAGAGIGTGVGETVAQGIELLKGKRASISPGVIAAETVLGAAAPVQKLLKPATTIGRAAATSAEGALLSGASTVARTGIEQKRLPTGRELGEAVGAGALIGGTLGAIPQPPKGFVVDTPPIEAQNISRARSTAEPTAAPVEAGGRPTPDAGAAPSDQAVIQQPAKPLTEEESLRQEASELVESLAAQFGGKGGIPTKTNEIIFSEFDQRGAGSGAGVRNWVGMNIDDIPVLQDIPHGKAAIENALAKRKGPIWDEIVLEAENTVKRWREEARGDAWEPGEPVAPIDFTEPPPGFVLDKKPEPIADVSKQLADAGQRMKGEAANGIVGQLGMKAAGPPKSAGDIEGSPLFPSKQKSFFSEEAGSAPLNPLRPVLDAYTSYVGTPIWDMIERIGRKITPKGLQLRPGQPQEYIAAAEARTLKSGQGREKALSLGKRLTQGVDREEQVHLGRLIKGEVTEADLRQMRNDTRWNDAVEAAKEARLEMDTLGGQAVMQGLLKDETFFRNYGKYMPRLYRKHEVDYEGLFDQLKERKPTRLELSRFMKRDDIPEDVRLLMGEILEPGYPVAKGIAQVTRDVETAKLFNFVANNTEWTFKSKSDLFDQGKNPADYVEMPTTKKLGRLSGQHVLKPIADDLNTIIKVDSDAKKLVNKLVSEWKFGKVVLNPATHGRNILSNAMLAELGGLPMARVDVYAQSLFELSRKGKYYKEAKDLGLLGNTYAQAEFDALLDTWNKSNGSLLSRMAKRPSQTWLGRKAAGAYQAEEQWFKLAKFIHNRRQGMTPEKAAADSNKWLFDYSDVPKYIDWARKSPFGAPFITFTYKALPAIAESAVKYPWRIAALLSSIYAVQKYSSAKLGISEDQAEKIEKVLPERMRGSLAGGSPKFLLMPFKDKYGQLQFLDLTYILPWGDIGETGATGIPSAVPLIGSPAKVLWEVGLNKSSFTGKEIYKPTDTTAEAAQKISMFVYRMMAPSLAPGGFGFEKLRKAAVGRPDYFGRTRSLPTAMLDTLAGLKTTPIDPKLQRSFLLREKQRDMDSLQTDAFKIKSNRGLTKEEKKSKLEELRAKAKSIREGAKELR